MATRRRTKGTGEVYRRDNGTWAVRWRENGRRRYQGGFPSKTLADALLAKIRLELAHGRAGLPPDPTGFPTLAAEASRWLERRRLTHRAWRDDVSRWNVHLAPFFGHLRPADVDAGRIRAFVEDRLRAVTGKDEDGNPTTLNPATVGHAVRLLSTFFSDLIERPRETGVTANPVRSLPRSTRKLFKATHRPKDTPYIKQLSDVQALHAKLAE